MNNFYEFAWGNAVFRTWRQGPVEGGAGCVLVFEVVGLVFALPNLHGRYDVEIRREHCP